MQIINHEAYVSPEVAKLLRQAGFDLEVNHSYPNCDSLDNSCSGYMEDLPFYANLNDGKSEGMSVPTLEVAQRWLRIKWDLMVIVEYNYHKNSFLCKVYSKSECLSILFDFPVYEEALEVGIQKALKLILEKGE